MRRWFLALAQAAIMMVIIFGVLGLVDLIVPTVSKATATEWHWGLVAGLVCWGVLGAIFHRLDDPEEW